MVLPIPRRMLIVIIAVVIVISLIAIFVLPAVLTRGGLSTAIVITDLSGKQTTIYQDSVPFASVVNAAGIAMNQIAWYTTFTAASTNYQQYTILSNSTYKYGLFYGSQPTIGALLSGTTTQCSFFSVGLVTWPNLNVGTKYNLGDRNGPAGSAVISASASGIINWIGASCPTTGASFWLKYQVSLTVQAQGIGVLPYATYSQSVYTPISISAGSITLAGSSSAVVTWVGAGSLGG